MKPPRNPYLKSAPTNINSTAQPSGANVDNSVPSLEPPAGTGVDVTSTSTLKRSPLLDVSVAGSDAPMPFTFHPPTSLPSSRASRSVSGSAVRSALPSSSEQSSIVDVMVTGDDAPMPSTSKKPVPPSSMRASRSAMGSALRSADDVNHAPSSPIAPTALSYREKRNGNPLPSRDSVRSPPKSRRDMRRTPSRPGMSHRIAVASEGVQEVGCDTLLSVSTSTNVLATGISTLSLDADSIKKCKSIIRKLKSKPLSVKNAILKHRKKPQVIKKPQSKSKCVPTKRKQQTKTAKPTKKAPTKITSILHSSELLTGVRSHCFMPSKEDLDLHTKESIAKYISEFSTQLLWKFDARRMRNMAASRGLRSTVQDDLLDADFEGSRGHYKQLSRYVLDDVLGSGEDTPFLLCITVEMDEERFGGLVKEAAAIQIKNGLGGEVTKIGGKLFITLKVTMAKNDGHDELRSGLMQRVRFETEYGRQAGFNVAVDGTDVKLPFYWSHLIHEAAEIMFFGQLLQGSRNFYRHLRTKVGEASVFHAFSHLAIEYRGDSLASTQLYGAYFRRLSEIRSKLVEQAYSDGEAAILKRMTETTLSQKIFIGMFDGLCKNEFTLCLTEYNDYGTEILRFEDLDRFIYAAEHKAFPDQWKVLSALRGLNENRKAEVESGRNVYKKRQIFFQLLSLIRVSNSKLLSWWAMIQSVSNFGWGVSATASDINCYWGNTVSSTTRSDRLTELTANMTFHYRKLLKRSKAKLFCFDNVQIGEELKEMRGKRSSAFFKGTHMVTHKVHEYTNNKWNDLRTKVTGVPGQPMPSPPGMAPYENAPKNENLAQYIMVHDTIEGIVEPDMEGTRSEGYERVARMCYLLGRVGHVFTRSDESYERCPKDFDVNAMKSLKAVFGSEEGKVLLKKSNSFKKDAVDKWNEGLSEEITKSLFLGVVGIDEGERKGAGTITLDLLLKGGTLKETVDGSWDLEDGFEDHRNMVFGDRKTIECINSFFSTARGREPNLEESSTLMDRFEKASDTIMTLPGDWHTGLNIAQSIFKCFWKPLLSPMMEMLGWKRINEKVSGCYYQASRLIKLVNEELHRFMLHRYASESAKDYEDMLEKGDLDVLCAFSHGYQEWLRKMEVDGHDDQFEQVCALFLHMSDDFTLFVESYRSGDSILVERAYDWFVPVWASLGQKKYVAAYHDQLHQLLIKFAFDRLHEVRLNRFVRTHPRSANKGTVAHDEYMELGNRLFAMFPKMRTLKGYIRSGTYVGLAQKTKKFSQKYYRNMRKKTEKKRLDKFGRVTTRKGTKADQTPERKLIYEVFSILFKVKHKRRNFTTTTLLDLSQDVKTCLKNEKLEKRMKDVSECSATRLFNGINQIWAEQINLGTEHVTDNDLDEINDIAASEEAMSSITVPEDCVDTGDPVDDLRDDAKMPKFATLNPWVHGTKLMIEEDYIMVHVAQEERKNRKRAVGRFIVSRVRDMKLQSRTKVGSEAIDPKPASWSHTIQSFNPKYYK